MNRPFDLGSTLLRDATEADAHLPDPTRECTITNSYTNKNIEKTTSADMAPCRQLSSSVVNVVKQGTEHTDLARAAKHLIKGGADLLFVEKTLQSIALGQTRPFPLHDIPAIITSASELAGRRERNLTAEVREWILSSSGVFLSSEIAKVSSLS